MAYHYSNPKRVNDPNSLPDIEVFYDDDDHGRNFDGDGNLVKRGWYWWSCFPGCLPDGEPNGPFETEQEAVDDAQSDYDDDEEDDRPDSGEGAVAMKVEYRPYRCSECGNEVSLQTNHTGPCYPYCKGKCRKIINPHAAREIVLPKQTEHVFIGEKKD